MGEVTSATLFRDDSLHYRGPTNADFSRSANLDIFEINVDQADLKVR